jgi:type I restriction enzyme M protein
MDVIIDAYTRRVNKDHFIVKVSNSDIAAQEYNLSVSTYVEQKDTREVIDIAVLNAEIEEIVAREQVLREEISRIIAEIELPAGSQVEGV